MDKLGEGVVDGLQLTGVGQAVVGDVYHDMMLGHLAVGSRETGYLGAGLIENDFLHGCKGNKNI